MRTFQVHNSTENEDVPAQTAMRDVNRWELATRAGVTTIEGRLLGFGSSQRRDHTHYEDVPPPKQRCPACRWQEVRLFRVERVVAVPPDSTEDPAVGTYVVHTLGPSLIVGERTFSRCAFANSGYEVVELLTVRRGDRSDPYLPAAAARALSQAAGTDNGVQDAYVNRAVA